MAENKNSFLLYTDYIHTVEGLSDEESGRLFKHILRYVNDKDPVAPDRIIELVFEPIKQSLKRDLKKWEKKSVKLSENGHLGGVRSGEVRREKAKQKEANEANASESKQNEANEAVSVSVIVSDIVIGTEIPLVSTNVDTSPPYSGIDKSSGPAIGDYIAKYKPKEFQPYMDLWNLFAKKKGCAEIKTMSETRKKKLKVRLGEKAFDFVAILTAAAKQKFALEGKWFGFDFIIENDNNYLKVLEMKYMQAAPEKTDGTPKIEISPRRNATFE